MSIRRIINILFTWLNVWEPGSLELKYRYKPIPRISQSRMTFQTKQLLGDDPRSGFIKRGGSFTPLWWYGGVLVHLAWAENSKKSRKAADSAKYLAKKTKDCWTATSGKNVTTRPTKDSGNRSELLNVYRLLLRKEGVPHSGKNGALLLSVDWKIIAFCSYWHFT